MFSEFYRLVLGRVLFYYVPTHPLCLRVHALLTEFFPPSLGACLQARLCGLQRPTKALVFKGPMNDIVAAQLTKTYMSKVGFSSHPKAKVGCL